MTNTYFNLSKILGTPLSREKALTIIKSDSIAYQDFQNYDQQHKELVLDFIQGNRGLPILYDSFFKTIMDPTITPERLESFLSLLLNQKVTISEVLPKEGSQLAELGSLVIMDIVVQLEDGSYVDVEMQKYGYAFTGERSTCYLSDLIMRQYNRVKSIRQKNFSYKDMKPVYLIVLMEDSAKELKLVSPYYIHRSQHTFDSGADLNLLTNLIFISLDTFHKIRHNIGTELDAWLTFLSANAPEDILNLVQKYPFFLDYYREISEFRKKPRELMSMFSKALLQMDRNTANYMIEEQAKEYEAKLAEKDAILAEKDAALTEKDAALAELESRIAELEKRLAQYN